MLKHECTTAAFARMHHAARWLSLALLQAAPPDGVPIDLRNATVPGRYYGVESSASTRDGMAPRPSMRMQSSKTCTVAKGECSTSEGWLHRPSSDLT